MQSEEKLVYVQSDMLLHELQFEALRNKISTLEDYEIHDFMLFQYYQNDILITFMPSISDIYSVNPDFPIDHNQLLLPIKNGFTLMTFKALKDFLQ